MIAFLRSIWTFVRPYQFRLILGLLCGILYALTNGALVIVIKLVVNLLGHVPVEAQLRHVPAFARQWIETLLSEPIPIICAIPVIMFLRGLSAYLNIYLVNWASIRAIADLRARLFGHLQNMPLDFFSRASTGDLISRITSDTQALQNVIGGAFASLVRDPITIVFLLAVLLWQQPALTLISIIVLPVCIVPIAIYAKRVRKSARAIQSHAAELSTLMHESFTGNRIIKAYNLEETVLARFAETTKKYVGHVMRVVRANEIPGQIVEFLSAVGVTLILLYVVLIDKSKTAGDFAAFVTSIFLMYQPIKTLTRLHNQLEQARSASHRVFELLETKRTIVEPASPVPLTAANADIRFENVDFDYGERPVLRGINLTVKAGQLVALVGSSGSGKTTITNLLLRFYDPQRGGIRIGKNDIRQVSIKDLRSRIALVTQETILFHDTIRRNIAYGRPGASDAEIETAARHANAHDFILEKPQRYETIAGEKGAVLSGGQRQRIAIARAILKDAPILVLDEATSALDSESERIVQAALEELMRGRTTICIAHRLSTIQRADVIVVLDKGRIVETGTHAELLQRGGIYCKLYELQMQPA